MLFRSYLQQANGAGDKDTTRRLIRRGNCEVEPGTFDGLKLETGRGGRPGEMRAQCVFEGDRVRVVSVRSIVRPGDLFWVKTGRFGKKADSRQTLEVLSVTAARVQDMNDDDAKREGIDWIPHKLKKGTAHPRLWFRALWDDINGGGSWDENPWVWVYRYRVHLVGIGDFL